MNENKLIPSSKIRSDFASAMSVMYRNEVPMYGTLVDMVQQINQQELENQPELRDSLESIDGLQRLSAERHGAIRLGKAEELFTMRRLFSVMGMFPVSYYDLSEAGIPVHSTAFRPLELEELNANPFRIFTSLLRLDLINDDSLRQRAEAILDNRTIFTEGVLKLIEAFEKQKGLTSDQTEMFISEALETFRWHQQATVDLETYQQFLSSHRLIADIVCFRGPHINHLTPRTLNIDVVQSQMKEFGLNPKAIIEGPPGRLHPVLLRQTSFKALDEKIEFTGKESQKQSGSHTARFGEIEQRGMALTPKGRALYDKLLNEVRQAIPNPLENVDAYYRQLEKTFEQFPDDLSSIRSQGLAYFNYHVISQNLNEIPSELDLLIDNNIIQILPITYEDFLPVSAAGIFQSNLDDRETQDFNRSPNQQAFEHDLGCPVINEFEFYSKIQSESLTNCLQKLGIDKNRQVEILHQLTRISHRRAR